MSFDFTLSDPELERQAKLKRKMMITAIVISFCLLAYPKVKEYLPQWYAMKAASRLVSFLSNIKTQAVLKKNPLKVMFEAPDLLVVYEVSSCGISTYEKKLSQLQLSNWAQKVVFVSPDWVRTHTSSREHILRSFCYDPLYGSSLAAEGLLNGTIFLAHQDALENKRPEYLVRILAHSASADLAFE